MVVKKKYANVMALKIEALRVRYLTSSSKEIFSSHCSVLDRWMLTVMTRRAVTVKRKLRMTAVLELSW